ncbi:MAG TPA: Mov34/MPN/PAD-1 family protein [Candidatus Lokiarchaeia archaeon]|nr:Mov34/MPN/PAD-1 family protein [Candidatus Lokiarchaeia archaeon]
MAKDREAFWQETVVRFPYAFVDDVISMRHKNLPNEACALLFGKIESDDHGQRVEIIAMRELENILHSPVAFEIDPEAEYRVIVEETASGHDLVGILHTHPGSQFVSATDRRYMINADIISKLIWLIAGDGEGGELEIGGYVIEGGKITKIPIDYF